MEKTSDDKGSAGGAAALAVSAVVFLPAGFFMTGTSARMPAGTTIKGFFEEDVPVVFATGNDPAPIVVPNTALTAGAVLAPEISAVPAAAAPPK